MAVLRIEVLLLRMILFSSLVISSLTAAKSSSTSPDQLKRILDKYSDLKLSNGGKNRGCTNDYKVDHLRLRMSWGPGYCSSGKAFCRAGVKPEFTIHGLWPQQKDKENPEKCCTEERFEIKALTPIKAKLRQYWPSISGSDDEGFWSYQWDKHGSCATKITSLNKVYDYFNFAVSSMKGSDLTTVTTKRFKPSNDKLYYGHAIIMALAQVYGAKISIECSPLKNKPQWHVVTEVSACFNTNLEFIDCPYTKRRCLEQVLLPSQVL